MASLWLQAQEEGSSESEDGGAAAFGSAVIHADRNLADSKWIAEFPIAQRATIQIQGGGVRGFGMLAEYAEGGPGRVVVTRETSPVKNEPFAPITLARVVDPDGNVVAAEEFTDQVSERESRVLQVPRGKAGIWRVSFSGGRKGDLVEIRLPETKIWGVRGEMLLGVTATTPRPAYFWVAPRSPRLLVGVEAGAPSGISINDVSGKKLAQPQSDPTKRVGRLVIDPAPADSVCRLNLPQTFSGSIVIEGTPGLLCPTEAAAKRLRGGTVESHGLLVSGPLQARARDWMVRHIPSSDPVTLSFPSPLPKLATPQIDALLFGKYGPLGNINGIVTAQNRNLNPASPLFGSMASEKSAKEPTWADYQPESAIPWDAPASLASAIVFKSPINPVYGSQALTERSALAAFYRVASMQGDDLMREGSLFRTRYPMTLGFFYYQGDIAHPYFLLRDHLDAESREIWRQAAMAIGDKIADFQGYESNQWSHMLRAHLSLFQATGEKRFLGYFERLVTSYFDNTFGPSSKFGQHPAGYYLEECGPDGNYDRLNGFCVTSCYYDYRALPEAKPALVEKMRNGIEKSLRFRSFYWLPEPDGDIHSPTAFNCRTEGILAGAGYPGDFMAKSDFPLGLARYRLSRKPAKGIGQADLFAHVANTEEWLQAVIENGVRNGGGENSLVKSAGGWWAMMIRDTYVLPEKVEPAVIPVEETDKTWTLPGMLAWKRGALYGNVFYDVPGANHRLKGITGGGPTVFWKKETGSFLCGMVPAKPVETLALTDPAKLTFACVFGREKDGRLFYSGKERAQLETRTADTDYVITASLEKGRGTIQWAYHIDSNGVTVEVSVEAPSVTDLCVNLPLLKRLPGVKIQTLSDTSAVWQRGDARAEFQWEGGKGQILPSTLPTIDRLVISLAPGQKRMRIVIR